MKQYFKGICLLLVLSCITAQLFSQSGNNLLHKALAPLYRDPIYDGAADPVIIYNRPKKNGSHELNCPVLQDGEKIKINAALAETSYLG